MVPEGDTTYDSLISVVLTGESELNLSVILDLPSIESALPGMSKFEYTIVGKRPIRLLVRRCAAHWCLPHGGLYD